MRGRAPHLVWLAGSLLLCLAAGRAADDAAALRSATQAIERGDFSSAEQTLRAALQAQPDDAALLSLLGVALDNQKQFREADELHRRALERAPRSADVQSNYGNHLILSAGDEKGAREAYLKAIEIDAAHPNANVQLARLALNQRNGAEALACLKRLTAQQQDVPTIALLKAQALYLNGDQAEADALVDRLSAAAQDDPNLSYLIGATLGDAGHFDKAESFLFRALAAAPTDFNLLYRAGVAASSAGHNERALEALQAALARQPQNVDALYALAWVNKALRKREAALSLLAQASQRAPGRADVQKLLAITTAEIHALYDSIVAWDRYLALQPNDDVARCERGLVAIRLGRFDEGMADLQWFIKRHPGEAAGYYYLGLAESIDDPDQALRDLNKALEMKPDFADAHSSRGALYYQQGNPEAALPDLESAAARQPDDAVTLDRLGETYVALDRLGDAVRVLRKAAELEPSDSTTMFHFARALALAGQTAESEEAMDRFQKLGPAEVVPVKPGLVEYLTLTPEQRRADYRARVQQAVEKDPSDAAAQLRYLKLSLDDGEVDRAAAAARRLADLKPPLEALADAGRALMEANQYSLAKQLLEQAAAMGPSADLNLSLAIATFYASGAQDGLELMERAPEPARSGDYYLALAQMLGAAGKPADAAAALDRALRAAPQRSDIYRQTAIFLVRAGQTADALRLLDRAAANLPQEREIPLMKAATLELAGRTGEAETLLEQIERHWPEWHAVWVARGVVMATHRRFEEARQALETAISLGAHSPEVYFYLADSTLRSAPKQAGAAEAAIGQALKLKPEDPWIQTVAGRIALEKGDYATAVERLRNAVRLRPGFLEAHNVLAQAYNALGRKAEAQAELEGVKNIQADNEEPPYRNELFQVKPPRDW